MKRYTQIEGKIYEHPNGEWVKWEDVESLVMTTERTGDPNTRTYNYRPMVGSQDALIVSQNTLDISEQPHD